MVSLAQGGSKPPAGFTRHEYTDAGWRTRALARALAALVAVALVSCTSVSISGCAPIQSRVAGAYAGYFDATTLHLEQVLPAPPANDSPETRAELDSMLKIQSDRSPAEAERARADATVSVYRFADALGNPPAFDARHLPLTDALFRNVLAAEGAVMGGVKQRFARPRPVRLEPRLEPVVSTPPNGSYPSGHTTWSRTVGLVLAAMIPERSSEIMKRADEYAFNRVVAGVHYPSDVEGGKLAGTALAAFLFASPQFLSDYAAARDELRRALSLPAQPH